MLVGSFLLMGCVGEELKFMDVKMQIDENGNATRVSMKMSYLINKTEVDNFLLEIEDTDGLGVTLSEWNSLSEVDQLELLLTKSVEDREMGGRFFYG